MHRKCHMSPPKSDSKLQPLQTPRDEYRKVTFSYLNEEWQFNRVTHPKDN